MNTTVRCFKRPRETDKHFRCGMWIMTQEARGAFFHGDQNEVQSPRPNISELVSGAYGAVEITPEEALAELDKPAPHERGEWTDAKKYMQEIFDRHPIATTEAKHV